MKIAGFEIIMSVTSMQGYDAVKVGVSASACSMHGLLCDPEYAGRTFLRNVRGLLPDYTALHRRR
jgi:hypothetical protein